MIVHYNTKEENNKADPPKVMDIVQKGGKYYIEVDSFHSHNDSLIELVLSLSRENEQLRERIKTLENKEEQ